VWMVPLRVLRTADVWRGMLPSLACAYVLMVGAIIVAWRLTLRGPSWQRAVSTLAALALMVSLLSFPARHTQLLAAARHLAADTARLHAEALAAGATRADQVATNSFELMFSPAPEPGDPVRLYRRVDTPGWFTNTPAFREDFGWHVPTSYEDLHTWARSQGIKVIYLDSPPRQIRAPFEPSAVPSALFETRWFNEGTSMLLRVE